jgi:predicted Zn-dependent protease
VHGLSTSDSGFALNRLNSSLERGTEVHDLKARFCLLVIAGLFAGTIALALGSCAISPATGRPVLTGMMTTAQEARIGREEYPQIIQAFGGTYADRALQSYIGRVGQSLARHTERADTTYTFTILDSPVVNALSTPGGYVYVTRGLLALADNEAEVAGVLGHELGHITARHQAQQQSRQTLASIGLAILAATVNVPPALMQGTQLAALSYLASFSREQEFEADQLGARYMARAGYDPHALADFLTTLQAYTNLEAAMLGRASSAERFDFLATHPTTSARVDSAIAAARVAIVSKPTVGRDSYLDAIDGMTYGESGAQGFIRGRVFSHPDLRIRFEVPPEYHLFNTHSAVYALGPGGATIIFDAAPAAEKLQSIAMVQYVSGAVRPGLPDVKATRINGLEAATGSINVDTNRGRMELRLAAIRVSPTAIYRFRFLTPAGLLSELGPGNFRTLDSFRRLTTAEATALKPLRIHLVTVKKGQTVASLARTMPFERYEVERFGVLNGIAPNAKLVPGQRVKVITE